MYVHYCNTHYDVEPPVDINPLILQKFKNKPILAICARHSMEHRINQMVENAKEEHLVLALGLWDAEEVGLIEEGRVDPEFLYSFSAVVIISRNRISEEFTPIIKEIENILQCKLQR